MKICKGCKNNKALNFFSKRKNAKDGYDYYCKDCASILNKKYEEENKEAIKERRKQHYRNNKERLNLISKEYYENNKEKANLVNKKYFQENKYYKTNYRKNRKLNDPLFKLTENIRKLIYNAVYNKGYSKKSRTNEILGCSFEELKLYLESKFESYMSWDNYGRYNGEFNYGWDIDHIIPLSSAKTEEDIFKLNHYTNLQPLCSKVNRYIKKDKTNYEM